MTQLLMTDFFAYTRRVATQLWKLPKDLESMVRSFLKETIRDEIKSGKQHTMTEYLDDNSASVGEYCFCVDTNKSWFGPFRHKEDALKRANDLVKTNSRTYVQVLSYDSRYLDDRSGNWCDLESVYLYDENEL